ncbi:MAG TPA: VIT domain-containing protein, partial [Gemmatimonadaceae bacterium]|nr:VIT domain-containing protein [Gemmatimonadaceae bacterium]
MAIAAPECGAGAQGLIIPRTCGAVLQHVPTPPLDLPRRAPPVVCTANVIRARSDIRVSLADRVLHYEVDEHFVNRGAGLGEADYIFPLPAGAAFQDLQLSIGGELVSGETMNAVDARRTYENIVRTQRDPALVEWMGHGLLRARVFPLAPGEDKEIVVRFQTVAPREGDALRIDYFRGGATGEAMMPAAASGGRTSFTFTMRAAPDLGMPYSPTHTLDVSEHDGTREAVARGDARDITLLVPLRRSSSAAITMLPYAPGNDDGFALLTVT